MRNLRIVSVTGDVEQDFESDLIIWSTSFQVHHAMLSDAYMGIKRERTAAQESLQRASLKTDGYTFESLEIS